MKAYLWMIRGFSGLVLELEKMTEEGERMAPEVQGELEQMLAKLTRLLQIQRRRVQGG